MGLDTTNEQTTSSDFFDVSSIDDVLFGGEIVSDSAEVDLPSILSSTLEDETWSDSSDDSYSTATDSTATVSDDFESDSEFYPSPAKKLCPTAVSMSKGLFICETSQVEQFVGQINSTSTCHTPRCSGKLIPVNVKLVGLGGAAIIKFACTGCSNRNLAFHSSVNVALSKRTVVSLALQVAFVISGCAYAQYSKVLK